MGVVWGLVDPPVSQLVVRGRGLLAGGLLESWAVAVYRNLLAVRSLVELGLAFKNLPECPLPVVRAVPLVAIEPRLPEQPVHPLSVAVRPEAEVRAQREVRPRLVAVVFARVSSPQPGELVAVLCLHGEREQLLVADIHRGRSVAVGFAGGVFTNPLDIPAEGPGP